MSNTLYLTYHTFKFTAENLPVYWTLDGDVYHIVCVRDGRLFISRASDDDVVDFELWKDDEKECSSLDDACAMALVSPLSPSPKMKLDCPSEQDKKPIVTISPATEGFVTWITGAGDDAEAQFPESGRGTGTPFVLSFSEDEVPCTKTLEFDFIEPVEVHDGQVSWRQPQNWGSQDSFSLGLRIPSSSVNLNTSSLGNCNKIPIGPEMNMIVPAAGDGQYDLIEACPVQDRQNQGGFWDNEYATGVVTPNSVPGKGLWNLFDFEITGWLIKNIPMTHPMGVFDIDVYKTEYFHPSWYLTWRVNKQTPGAGDVSGWIFCFRRFVT